MTSRFTQPIEPVRRRNWRVTLKGREQLAVIAQYTYVYNLDFYNATRLSRGSCPQLLTITNFFPPQHQPPCRSESGHGLTRACPRFLPRARRFHLTKRAASRVYSPHQTPLQIRNVSNHVPPNLSVMTAATRRTFHLIPFSAL
jgi:hypothetical protein